MEIQCPHCNNLFNLAEPVPVTQFKPKTTSNDLAPSLPNLKGVSRKGKKIGLIAGGSVLIIALVVGAILKLISQGNGENGDAKSTAVSNTEPISPASAKGASEASAITGLEVFSDTLSVLASLLESANNAKSVGEIRNLLQSALKSIRKLESSSELELRSGRKYIYYLGKATTAMLRDARLVLASLLAVAYREEDIPIIRKHLENLKGLQEVLMTNAGNHLKNPRDGVNQWGARMRNTLRRMENLVAMLDTTRPTTKPPVFADQMGLEPGLHVLELDGFLRLRAVGIPVAGHRIVVAHRSDLTVQPEDVFLIPKGGTEGAISGARRVAAKTKLKHVVVTVRFVNGSFGVVLTQNGYHRSGCYAVTDVKKGSRIIGTAATYFASGDWFIAGTEEMELPLPRLFGNGVPARFPQRCKLHVWIASNDGRMLAHTTLDVGGP